MWQKDESTGECKKKIIKLGIIFGKFLDNNLNKELFGM